MRKKILVLAVLCCILFLSLIVGTLSTYTTGSSFGINVYPDVSQKTQPHH